MKHLPTKFDRMLNADPVNPVWGRTCPWDPRYGRFGEGLGAVSSVGAQFCQLGTQPTKNCFGRNLAPPVLGIFLAHQNRVPVSQLSCSDDVGWFHASFSRNSRFTGFWRGLGDLENFFCGRLGPKTGQKRPKVDVPGLGGHSGRKARRPNLITCYMRTQ